MKNLLLLLLFMSTLTANAANTPKLKDPIVTGERVIFHTNVGDIVLGFYPDFAPKHVAQILKMSKAGVYDGMTFYRIEPGFVLQIENYDARKIPLSPEQMAQVANIPAEFSKLPHQRGTLSMARFDQDINSAQASFSILLGNAPHLDGHYTIFGQVVAGMDVVSAIEQMATDEHAIPRAEIIVLKAEVVGEADLTGLHLQGAQLPLMPNERSRSLFIIFAGFVFFMTVATPVYKNLTNNKS